ncbi:MAG: UDP-N-acetylmuramoyl-L-alanyl-D-glutamate--2,6-diaminopimelate ligase [Lachnospiraceae bacterium]|jgi:UDP-N-acetylmuramoyl-L-alanyl-D-glutamate--2,6-diaminopimelate ligase|nr:UDP-N-acetylmuramoyl-L-alanyl-D-glutamate--2,6-diaminopimelate ligase [Lachnospiraceae bacterium]
MTLKKLIQDFDYEVVLGDINKEITTLTNDSRTVIKDGVFVAISGAVSDGHKFVLDVSDMGVGAIIVEYFNESWLPLLKEKNIALIKVSNSRYALSLMSRSFYDYPDEKLHVIGITGTKGKTTTTYMIKSILENTGKKVGLIGTIETVIGDKSYPNANTTPESIKIQEDFRKMVDEGIEIVVMEVSSQGLKLDRVAGIPFEIGIFTNIGEDHIGPNEHKDFNEYLECKAKLFKMCKYGIGNIDDKHYNDIFKDATCIKETYGFNENADVRASEIEYFNDFSTMGVRYHVSGLLDFNVQVDIPGKFTVYNSLTAISVCRHFNVPTDAIINALKKAKVRGRIEMMNVSDDFTLMIDYAHNAMSLESLLLTLKEYNPGRIVTVFGCGGNRSKTRRFEMGEVSGKLSDFTIITSDNPRFEDPELIIKDIIVGMEKTNGKYISITDRGEAIKYAVHNAKPKDVIIIAGKGHETYQEIKGVKHHMDDRELVRDALNEIR